VIHFIDRALAEELAAERSTVLQGLALFLTDAGAAHADQLFSELDPAAQDAFLTTREGSDFFEFVRVTTIFGFFAMSSHGGNRDHLSWSLIGFEGHGAWTAPFGHYDAEAAR
jgi:hypothetical protein